MILGILTVVHLASAMQGNWQPTPIVPFRQLWEDTTIFDGRRIRVTGWLGTCTRSRCNLFSEARGTRGISISMGDSALFDRAVRRLRSRWITVEGTVRVRCFGGGTLWHDEEGGMIVVPLCRGHRSPQFADPRLVDPTAEPVEY